MADDEQDWVREGARVYIDSGRGVTRGVIARLTKTQIILETGGKFSRRTLRPVGEQSAWDLIRLVSADNPVLQARELEQRRDKAAWNVQRQADRFRKEPTEENASAIEAAITVWRSLGASS